MSDGCLYLVPVPIAAEAVDTLPLHTVEKLHELRHFIAENARSCRRFIKTTDPPFGIGEIEVFELDKHDPVNPDSLLEPLSRGLNVGLMSEAGCPAIADPGAAIVARAHEVGIRVIPLTGPSSILLALMSSGLGGQKFTFHGYLPRDKTGLIRVIRKIEGESKRERATQIFIEAPYRNNKLLSAIVQALSPTTLLCIASMLTSSEEYIATRPVAEWKRGPLPDLHKKETVFLLRS